MEGLPVVIYGLRVLSRSLSDFIRQKLKVSLDNWLMFVNGEVRLWLHVHGDGGERLSSFVLHIYLLGALSWRSSNFGLWDSGSKTNFFFEVSHEPFLHLVARLAVVNLANDHVVWHGVSSLWNELGVKEGVDVNSCFFWRLHIEIKIVHLALHFLSVHFLNFLSCERLQRELHV